MTAQNGEFQAKDRPEANLEYEEAFRAAFGLDPDAPENRLAAFRSAREEIESKGQLSPNDLKELRTIDREIARAQFEIFSNNLAFWRKVDANHPRIKEHEQALVDLTAKYPELAVDDQAEKKPAKQRSN